MNQETLPTSQNALPDTWAERLFQVLEDSYGSLWIDRYAGLDRQRVKRTWAARLGGYSAEEIKRGVDATMLCKFPPTLPEFLQLCRPTVDPRTEWAEACEQMRLHLQGNGEATWSRPEVYWAAIKIGAYDLNVQSWDQIKTRWMNALAHAKNDPVPEFLAPLPAPGKQSMTKEIAEKMTRQLGAIVDAEKKDPRAWARKILANPDNFPHISVQFAKQALESESGEAIAA
ncbi:MAG: hypothetical protein ACYC0M_15705 [Burkholderiales bacterium]